MPSLVKCLACVMVLAWSGGLKAQTAPPRQLDSPGPQLPAFETTRTLGMATQRQLDSPGPQPPAGGASAAPCAAAGGRAAPLLPARAETPIPLPRGRGGHGEAGKPALGGLPAIGPMASGLAVALGLFLAVAWVFRRAAPKSATLLPGEVVEVLGRAPLAGRQQMHLLRCGNKLLLVSVTPAGAETLTEVTDPVEVDRLAGLCRQAHPHSATATFRNIFQQLGSQAENGNG